MLPPNGADLLDALDRGAHASNAERALLLLGTVRPEPFEELAWMPLGRVAAGLLELRKAIAGSSLQCLSDCGQCGTAVECEIAVEELTGALAPAPPSVEPLLLMQEGYEVEFRLPVAADLMALRGDAGLAARGLAERLIARASVSGEPVEIDVLPPEIRDAIEGAVLEHDPLAEVQLAMMCPGCGNRWSEALDVGDFVWREVSALGQRLSVEVARLAYAFGWSERDILAMSEQRRRRYLELLPA